MVFSVSVEVIQDNFFLWFAEILPRLRKFFVRYGVMQELKRLRRKQKRAKRENVQLKARITDYERVLNGLKCGGVILDMQWNRSYIESYTLTVKTA